MSWFESRYWISDIHSRKKAIFVNVYYIMNHKSLRTERIHPCFKTLRWVKVIHTDLVYCPFCQRIFRRWCLLLSREYQWSLVAGWYEAWESWADWTKRCEAEDPKLLNHSRTGFPWDANCADCRETILMRSQQHWNLLCKKKNAAILCITEFAIIFALAWPVKICSMQTCTGKSWLAKVYAWQSQQWDAFSLIRVKSDFV